MSTKFVDFYIYCQKCKHKNVIESEDPCHECLNEPVREDSRKPIKYEEK